MGLSVGHWVIKICHCRFINCNKYTTLMGDIQNRVGSGYIGNLYFPPKFAVNIKLFLKVYLKKNPCKRPIVVQIF